MPARSALRSPTGRSIVLPPHHANAGLEVAYRKLLDRLIDAMQRDIVRRITRTWKEKPPELAQDDDAPPGSPAMRLRREMEKLGDLWQSRFDEAASELAKYFATKAAERSDVALKAILRKSGFSVKFTMSRAANDAYQATIGENVGLIKSIASQHLTQVQGSVMRSVQAGGDLGTLAKELQQHYGVTKRRAALIARDQNRKANATITRVRQQELGITQAMWMHSAGGKVPRPTHVKAWRDRTVYNVAEGWFDPDVGRKIFPGELINCRCVSRSIIPGFE